MGVRRRREFVAYRNANMNVFTMLAHSLTMQLNDTHMFDKGDLAYVALNAIEEFVRDKGYKLGLGSDDGIHQALWEALGYVEVDPA